MTLSETIAGAVMYMYFVALSGGLGLLTAVGIGYKLYTRSQRKNGYKGQKMKNRGIV